MGFSHMCVFIFLFYTADKLTPFPSQKYCMGIYFKLHLSLFIYFSLFQTLHPYALKQV